MPTAIEKELKKEILQLPQGEKDKLLLRLVAKDGDLVERLRFVLIEEETTTDERRLAVRESITATATGNYSNPDGWLLKAMRSLSSAITHHVKITKDKYGDVELSLYLLNAFFDAQGQHFRHLGRQNERICAYVAKKAESIVKKLNKLDPDYYIEFEENVNRMLTFIHSSGPGIHARQLGLAKQWND